MISILSTRNDVVDMGEHLLSSSTRVENTSGAPTSISSAAGIERDVISSLSTINDVVDMGEHLLSSSVRLEDAGLTPTSISLTTGYLSKPSWIFLYRQKGGFSYIYCGYKDKSILKKT